MIDVTDDYNLLNLGGLTSLVTKVNVSLWGNEVLLECLYDPTSNRLPYAVVFQDCRQIKWDVYHPEEVGDLEADLIGISLGKDAHRQPAVIHTDIFEISILYGRFSLQKGNISRFELESDRLKVIS